MFVLVRRMTVPLTSGRGRRVIRAVVTALLGLSAACNGPSGPEPGPLLLGVTFGCQPSAVYPYDCAPVLAADRGGPFILGEFLADTTDTPGAIVTVRALCRSNILIERGGVVVDSLPHTTTCADSLEVRLLAAPQQAVLRYYGFTIPASWTPGDYTVRTIMLVNPPLTLTRTLTVR